MTDTKELIERLQEPIWETAQAGEIVLVTEPARSDMREAADALERLSAERDAWFKTHDAHRKANEAMGAANAELFRRVREAEAERDAAQCALVEKRRDRVSDTEVSGAYLCRAEQAEADLNACLKSVLHHFGPEGANKVTTSALAYRDNPASTPAATGEAEPTVFEFDRYINGTLMAEGVTIERQPTLEGAMKKAALLASRGPNKESPVLVLRRKEAGDEAV